MTEQVNSDKALEVITKYITGKASAKDGFAGVINLVASERELTNSEGPMANLLASLGQYKEINDLGEQSLTKAYKALNEKALPLPAQLSTIRLQLDVIRALQIQGKEDPDELQKAEDRYDEIATLLELDETWREFEGAERTFRHSLPVNKRTYPALNEQNTPILRNLVDILAGMEPQKAAEQIDAPGRKGFAASVLPMLQKEYPEQYRTIHPIYEDLVKKAIEEKQAKDAQRMAEAAGVTVEEMEKALEEAREAKRTKIYLEGKPNARAALDTIDAFVHAKDSHNKCWDAVYTLAEDDTSPPSFKGTGTLAANLAKYREILAVACTKASYAIQVLTDGTATEKNIAEFRVDQKVSAYLYLINVNERIGGEQDEPLKNKIIKVNQLLSKYSPAPTPPDSSPARNEGTTLGATEGKRPLPTREQLDPILARIKADGQVTESSKDKLRALYNLEKPSFEPPDTLGRYLHDTVTHGVEIFKNAEQVHLWNELFGTVPELQQAFAKLLTALQMSDYRYSDAVSYAHSDLRQEAINSLFTSDENELIESYEQASNDFRRLNNNSLQEEFKLNKSLLEGKHSVEELGKLLTARDNSYKAYYETMERKEKAVADFFEVLLNKAGMRATLKEDDNMGTIAYLEKIPASPQTSGTTTETIGSKTPIIDQMGIIEEFYQQKKGPALDAVREAQKSLKKT